jgi:NAD+-dependent protein deacetylase sirtuin 6
MSAGYAARLSDYPNKGVVGLPEISDSKRQFKFKIAKLIEWVRDSKHLVVLTGAGISTSAGIPDFRGPKGVWTIEKQQRRTKKKRKREEVPSSRGMQTELPEVVASMDFTKARPTLTHRAMTKLAQAGKLKYCITQNVDGLHRRAGLSRNFHCALHGCAFTEKCHTCHAEFFRDEDVGGMSFQPTGEVCDLCHGNLHDTLLDWEDALPEKDLERAEDECDRADLVLCLGTSLRIEPAASLPLRAKRFAIINLQVTPYDSHAAMIIKAPVDEVMDALLEGLGFAGWKNDPPYPVERIWSPSAKKNVAFETIGDNETLWHDFEQSKS